MSGGQPQGPYLYAPPPQRRGIPDWVWIVGAAAVVTGGLSIAYFNGYDPTADATSVSSDPQPPITLSGQGDGSTDPLTLAGGAYSVAYRFDGSCYYGADLVPIDPGLFEFSEDIATGDGPVEGDGNVYDVEAGDYYVRVTTGPAPGCPWEITLTGG